MNVAPAAALIGVLGLAVAVHDRRRLTRLRRQLADVHHNATHDGLTGLTNRAGLLAAWPRLAPTRPMVAVVDLDGFKPVNDTHGHAAGDLVLVAVADRLRRVPGLAARLGGDEFTAVITGPDPQTIAERLAAAIAAPIRLPSGAWVSVTASIGLAPANTFDLPAVLAAADAAMYRAKSTRTGVAVYDPTRDDHTTTDRRPAVRVRDLSTAAVPVEVTC